MCSVWLLDCKNLNKCEWFILWDLRRAHARWKREIKARLADLGAKREGDIVYRKEVVIVLDSSQSPNVSVALCVQNVSRSSIASFLKLQSKKLRATICGARITNNNIQHSNRRNDRP